MTGTCPESRQDIRLNSSSLFPGKPILGPRNFQYCILIPRRIILLVEPKQRGLVKSSKYIFEKTPQKLPESSIEMWSVFPFCDLVHCFCRFMNQTQHPYLYIFSPRCTLNYSGVVLDLCVAFYELTSLLWVSFTTQPQVPDRLPAPFIPVASFSGTFWGNMQNSKTPFVLVWCCCCIFQS